MLVFKITSMVFKITVCCLAVCMYQPIPNKQEAFYEAGPSLDAGLRSNQHWYYVCHDSSN